ncbi:MAG: hypothetical protein PF541_15980 [Prolixibacteraceae bacterium]|jgi:hypothetical protein|nr:hypothetical protein [Prolixibacteraceae bacterium]
MKKLMHMIMLDCNEATRLTSIKKYKKLSLMQRTQLSMHLMACKFCNQFAKFNDVVDDLMEQICSNSVNEDSKLSEKKKEELETIIEEVNK